MELDVHLQREGEESWGFRLIGGKDFAMPLTVIKVLPNSPAAVAGLCNGDAVCRVNGADTSNMSHDDSKRFVADVRDLTLGVTRGLYDPVLDDYDPIYEPIDPEDFDQPSQPTEVDPFQIQQFSDPFTNGQRQDPRLTPGRLSELRDIETPCTGVGLNGLDQSRSLTASPFVLTTKPYRPFSTEPLSEVPPVEDPIILNPNYKDVFAELTNGEVLPETRFKLPISEQYDPDGTRKMKKEGSVVKEVKFVDATEVRKDVAVTEVTRTEELKKKIEEDQKFMKQMKQDIDLDKIERTAVSVVDESIERAVSVTDEIKKEIAVELQESSTTLTKVEQSAESLISKSVQESIKSTAMSELVEKLTAKVSKETSELVELIDKTTDEIVSYNGHKAEVSVAKEVQKIESHEINEHVIDERRQSTKQEIEETIEVGSVRRKSEVFDKKDKVQSLESQQTVEKKATEVKCLESSENAKMKSVQDNKATEKKIINYEDVDNKHATDKNVQKTTVKSDNVSQISEIKQESVSSQKTAVKSSTATSKTKLQSDHTKAYLIGLQTIPNIKGSIHSSCHYHLLLKTFFIHLTDVMVALSRFILTEPALSKTAQVQTDGEVVIKESAVTERKEIYSSEDHVVNELREKERKQSVKETKLENKQAEKVIVAEVESRQENKKEEASLVAVAKTKQEIEHKEKALVAEIVERKVEKAVALGEKVFERKEEKFHVKEKVFDAVKAEAQEVIVEAIEERRYKADFKENLEVQEIMERKEKLSGAQMAQVQERKSAELTHKMDAVITEFQNKAGIEETEIARERRSRSRSKVEDEVKLESDPLEWLSKQEMQQKGITELKTETTSFSSSSESTEKKRVEKHEKREKSSKSKEGKQMYVAIVESHVFTNKDAIFEEQVGDFSETSSVVSAEETNIALQASEVIATEKVSFKSEDVKQKVAETVLEESRELSVVNAKSEAIVQLAEEVQSTAVIEETKAFVEEVKKEKAIEAETKVVQEIVIQEVIEPIVEVQETKAVEISQDYQKLSLKEEEHVMSVSEKTEFCLAETHESIAVEETKQEKHAAVSIEESKAVEIVKEETQAVKIVKEEVKAAEVVKEETKTVEVKKDVVEDKASKLVKHEIKRVEYVPPPIQEISVECKVVQRARSRSPAYQEESAALTIVRPAKTPAEEKQEFVFLEENVAVSKKTEVLESGSHTTAVQSKMEVQEASFTAQSSESKTSAIDYSAKKRTLQLDLSGDRKLEKQSSNSSIASTIDTPTPGTVPPTPLTDEYMFKLKMRMPKDPENPIPRDCTPSPDDEDPNIVKKKLVPHIETILESPVIYDPPLPSPPIGEKQSPVYTKPGLKGGCVRQDFRKEEILEIERKSSLLASAIDETIKSIEEYKEEVGIDTKKEVKEEQTTNFDKKSYKTLEEHTLSKSEVTFQNSTENNQTAQPIIYNGYAKVENKVYDTIDNSRIDEEWNKIERQVKESSEELSDLSNNIDVEVDVTLKVNDEATFEGTTEIKHNIETELKAIKTRRLSTETVDSEQKSIEARRSIDVSTTELNKTVEVTSDFTSQSENTSTLKENGQSTETIELKEVKEETKPIVDTIEPNKESNKIDERKIAITNGMPIEATLNMNGNVSEKISPKTEVINGTLPVAVIEKPSAMFAMEEKKEPMQGYRPIQFDPEELMATKRGLQSIHLSVQPPQFQRAQSPSYLDSKGDLLGTHQGIVDALEEAVVDNEVAKELGKPGLTEQKIAELISGESEMLREAHVMGLSRVLKSHMHRADDDSSVDFKKIKPILQSLKESEVLKVLNEEIERAREKKKLEEEKKWTTFLQKPTRPVPKSKFGYPGWTQPEEKIEEPYKVKIVKQPKPKVAPDYKPKNFETGPLPWEERALNEPPPPPVEPEDPILIPEEIPEFYEAVDPLPESEVPDLEDTGIPLPPPPVEEATPSPVPEEEQIEETLEGPSEESAQEPVAEEAERVEEMEQNRLAEQLMMGVQNMVDPNASVEQQLAQMRAQVAALAQLPGVIQQTLELVTKQLSQLSQGDLTSSMAIVSNSECQEEMSTESQEYSEETQNHCVITEEETTQEVSEENLTNGDSSAESPTIMEAIEETKPSLTQEELEKLKKEEEEMLEEQRRVEKQKKKLMEQMKLEQESRQVKQRAAPRVGKPKQVFGPPTPVARPLVLPGGRRWRKPEDAYNEAFFAETLSSQAELLNGKTKGINFMKYEKPPVSLDHLKDSETYKLIHNMEQTPGKRVELLTPVVAEADYREKCRSLTPSNMADRLSIPQQVQP